MEQSVPHNIDNQQSPIVIVDVGARGGVDQRWLSSPYPVMILGFEPDEDECRRLNEDLPTVQTGVHPAIRYFPVALGRERGNRKLYLYKDRRLSSIFPPNMNLLRYFPLDKLLVPDAFSVEAEVMVECISLDEFCRKEEIPDIDFIKVDTQGSELEILQGGSKVLSQTFGVAVEVEFVPIYEGQPLFADVDVFLREKGFSLFDLNRHWWKRDVPSHVASRGQMVFADVLYLRDVPWSSCDQSDPFWHVLSTQPAKLAKTIVLASLLGYSDYAMNLLDFYRQRQLISERTYEVWRSSYIIVQSEQTPHKLSIWQRALQRISMSRVLGFPVARQKLNALNTRFYDNDESKDYR